MCRRLPPVHSPILFYSIPPKLLELHYATPLRERRRTSMTIDVSGGSTTVLSLLSVPDLLKVRPCLPKARLAGREMSLLSPTHMPLIDTSHPIGRAVPTLLLLLLLAALDGAMTKYRFSSEGRDPTVTQCNPTVMEKMLGS